MRHKLSYDLFLALSSPDAPRYAAASRFVEVVLNGKYQGAYLLMQRVDRTLLQLRPFSSNETRHACIYKAVDHAANFGQAGHAGYEQREPDPLIGAFWRPLDGFDRFVSSASDTEFFDPIKGISSRLDLDNAIDFHLLVLLTSNLDGITKNFILARDAPLAGSAEARFFFAPWDYDATFGRNWNATVVPPTAWLSNHLFDRLFAHPDYRKKYQARWNQLRKSQFSSKSLQAAIDENVRTLGDAVHRDAVKWRTAAGYYPDKLTFEEDIAQMKSWVEERLQWLDQKFSE
jgi:spore coat protein CotH